VTPVQVAAFYQSAPPIIQAAVAALLEFEETIEMGYDLSYYQDDLPATVAHAIKPWRQYDPELIDGQDA
jgi:hypothetical protein